MTQHSTRAISPLENASLRSRIDKRSWQVRLVLVAALLLTVAFLLHAGSTVHAADNDVSGVTLTSPNPGELVITWDAPSNAPDDYRVTWKKSSAKWPSYKNANTVEGGNAFPTGTSHTVTGLEEGTAYKARVRAPLLQPTTAHRAVERHGNVGGGRPAGHRGGFPRRGGDRRFGPEQHASASWPCPGISDHERSSRAGATTTTHTRRDPAAKPSRSYQSRERQRRPRGDSGLEGVAVCR